MVKRIFVILLAVVLSVFVFTSCSLLKRGKEILQPDPDPWAIPPPEEGYVSVFSRVTVSAAALEGLIYSDVEEALKVLSKTYIRHVLVDSDSGRIVVFDVRDFETQDIASFMLWAYVEYQLQPDLFFFATQETGYFSVQDALATNQSLSGWTHYTFGIMEYDGEDSSRIVFQADVAFPYAGLIGAGYAVTMEKGEDGWEITDTEMTWIS